MFHRPFTCDFYAAESHLKPMSDSIEKDLSMTIKTLKRMIEGDSQPRPFVGLHAVRELYEKNKKSISSPFVTVGNSFYYGGLPLVEVLSVDPIADANKFVNMVPGCRVSKSFKNSGALNNVNAGSDFNRTAGSLNNQVNEIIVSSSTHDLISFISISNCYIYGDENIAGIETVLVFLYRRLIFGPHKDDLSKELLRGLIGAMYFLQFGSKKTNKSIASFRLDRCVGKKESYEEKVVDKFQQNKVIRAYWPWKDFERARRQKQTRQGTSARCDSES